MVRVQDCRLVVSFLTIKTVLLTGGRAPGTLELARLFSSQGHMVHVADSFAHSLTRTSKSVKQFHLVSEPKNNTEDFIEELVSIIKNEQIDLLIPTCEEVFYIATHQQRLASLCEVFADDANTLLLLHDKFRCIQAAQSFGLSVPKTIFIRNKEKLKNMINDNPFERAVCKPVFSRFSTNVLFLPEDNETSMKHVTDGPWVYQERIDGTSFCSYSVCVNGNVLAHTVYRSDFRAGDGATISFEHIEHEKIQQWVNTFVEKTNFHGQIAFDFIQNERGEVFAIECNPRLTSGVHLFRDTVLPSAFLGTTQTVLPKKEKVVAIKLALLVYLFPNIRKMGFTPFVRCLKQAEDVVFQKKDKRPFFSQFTAFYQFWKRSKKEKISLLEATTVDISWDGEKH